MESFETGDKRQLEQLPPPHFTTELEHFNEVSSRTENDDDDVENAYVKDYYNDY